MKERLARLTLATAFDRVNFAATNEESEMNIEFSMAVFHEERQK